MIVVVPTFIALIAFSAFLVWSTSWGVLISIAGIVCVLVLSGALMYCLVNPDALRSQYTEEALTTASDMLKATRFGLTPESAKVVCERLLSESGAMAIAVTDAERVLAYVGEYEADFPPGSRLHSPATKEVLATGEPRTFTTSMRVHGARDPRIIPAGIVAPLKVRGKPVGTLKFYYHGPRDLNRTQHALCTGFAELLSTQLAISALERQTELTARAEIKALQAQINPHFLFNTLNTIAAFTRIDPMRARDLLREFASFYRATLENSGSLIPVTREITQTKRYLMFEKARFGEDRIKDSFDVEPGLEQLQVPSFLIQPLVENAVRHAMRDEGPLTIEVSVRSETDDVALITVSDDGVGMEKSVADALFAPDPSDDETAAVIGSADASARPQKSSQGAGIALRNIKARVEHYYGPGSCVNVLSEPNMGTTFVLRLDLSDAGLAQN